jgi:ATP-binding cassette, subfamily B, bacterial
MSGEIRATQQHHLFQRFTGLSAGQMLFPISHRFATAQMAEKFLELEGGNIAEQGPREELLCRGGLYARMFDFEAANYR